MAEERLSYTIPADAGAAGSQVDLVLTYDPDTMNPDGSFTVTDASGTYKTLDANGNVVDVDQVTGLAPVTSTGAPFANPDNELFVGSMPYVAGQGISFEIDKVTDSNDGAGAVNFFSPDGVNYSEDGANQNFATTVSEGAVVCFATSTLIRTASGDVAVEDLQVGDIAVTSSGAHRPIRWIGHRRLDCRRRPRPHEALPVRITAHAFGENRPARDLMVSPGHALCIDIVGEVLIPAAALVNGTTIRQEKVDEVTYWHVELDRHDILLAENMMAESYFDMGNRPFFAESAVTALVASPDAPVSTHADFCRPFHMAGALVEVVRAQLQKRVPGLGWTLEQPEPWSEVALEVDGCILQPKTRGLSACFELPAGAQTIWLTSSTSVPQHVSGSSDGRTLGLCLAAVTLYDGLGEPRVVTLDDPMLCVGFHQDQGDHRWTAGRARLPAELFAGLDGTLFLRLDLHSLPVPRWVPTVRQGEVEQAA